jgi:hypothetical protein
MKIVKKKTELIYNLRIKRLALLIRLKKKFKEKIIIIMKFKMIIINMKIIHQNKNHINSILLRTIELLLSGY